MSEPEHPDPGKVTCPKCGTTENATDHYRIKPWEHQTTDEERLKCKACRYAGLKTEFIKP
jgi:hypothetical protein